MEELTMSGAKEEGKVWEEEQLIAPIKIATAFFPCCKLRLGKRAVDFLFFFSFKLLTDTVNDKGWIGWDSWDFGRCVDFGWFPANRNDYSANE